jgi:hypothetical protein
VRRRIEVASPGSRCPSFRIAIARIAAAGGAFTFEDEVDPTKFARGVTDGATGLVISSGHGAPPLSLLLGGRSGECSAVVPIDLRRSWAKLRCERGRSRRGARASDERWIVRLLGCCRVAARSASALRNDRQILVAEMRVFVRV